MREVVERRRDVASGAGIRHFGCDDFLHRMFSWPASINSDGSRRDSRPTFLAITAAPRSRYLGDPFGVQMVIGHSIPRLRSPSLSSLGFAGLPRWGRFNCWWNDHSRQRLPTPIFTSVFGYSSSKPPAESASYNSAPGKAQASGENLSRSNADEKTRDRACAASSFERMRGICLATAAISLSNSSSGEPDLRR